jgi:hypothetical protein
MEDKRIKVCEGGVKNENKQNDKNQESYASNSKNEG